MCDARLCTGDMKDVCRSYIREVAVHPDCTSQVALGGFDHQLSLLDLNRPDTPFVQRLNMQGVISSVKWSPLFTSTWVRAARAHV